jgi:invasion protein IalB
MDLRLSPSPPNVSVLSPDVSADLVALDRRRRSSAGRRLSPRTIRAAAVAGAGFLALALGLAAAAPALAQGAVRTTHGDWQMRCETPPGAKTEQCALVQNVAAEDRPAVTLLVIVLRTADQKSRLLRIVAPLGVLLPSGLGLKIDDKDIGRAGFVRCLNTGCVAEVVMDDTLLNRLKGGQNATFIVFQTPEEGIGIPVSLDGFAKGMDSLP